MARYELGEIEHIKLKNRTLERSCQFYNKGNKLMGIFISEISIEQTFNLGNYENVKLGLKVSQTMTDGGEPVTDKDMWKTGITSVLKAFDFHAANLKVRSEAKAKKDIQIKATLGAVENNASKAQGGPK